MDTITRQVVAPDYVRIREAAQLINMSPAYLRKVARLGIGPERVRCGKVLLYPVTGLRCWMAQHTERVAS